MYLFVKLTYYIVFRFLTVMWFWMHGVSYLYAVSTRAPLLLLFCSIKLCIFWKMWLLFWNLFVYWSTKLLSNFGLLSFGRKTTNKQTKTPFSTQLSPLEQWVKFMQSTFTNNREGNKQTMFKSNNLRSQRQTNFLHVTLVCWSNRGLNTLKQGPSFAMKVLLHHGCKNGCDWVRIILFMQ